jgi:hypothetical protein
MKTLFFEEQERDTVAFDIVNDNALGHHHETRSKNKTNCCRGDHSSDLDYTNHSRRPHSLFALYTVRATGTPSSPCRWENNLVREKSPGARSPAHPKRGAEVWDKFNMTERPIFMEKSSRNLLVF